MKSSEASSAIERNHGIPLDPKWIESARVGADSVNKAAESIAARTAITKESQPWLLRVIQSLDLTTLAEDDTDERVRLLCEKAREPISRELQKQIDAEGLHVAAVCIYHRFIDTARRELEGTGIKVATVSADFPKGLKPLDERIAQIRSSVAAGADEIDVVIQRAHALHGDWKTLYDEVAAFRAACGPKLMKVILATGELQALDTIARASLTVMMAGADFIKTSTGKEVVNATLPAAVVMTRAIRDYEKKTGLRIGFKAAGGIRTAKQALEYVFLVREEMGPDSIGPNRFRIGASSVLDDIERRLKEIAA